jgi:hypothetical protein
MAQKFYGRIKLSKIDMSKVVTNDNQEESIDVVVWLNDDPDQYGNVMSIQQATKKEEKKIYLGNCKKSER